MDDGADDLDDVLVENNESIDNPTVNISNKDVSVSSDGNVKIDGELLVNGHPINPNDPYSPFGKPHDDNDFADRPADDPDLSGDPD